MHDTPLSPSITADPRASSATATGIGASATPEVLAPATARAVLNQPTAGPSELWAQAATLLSAGLEDD